MNILIVASGDAYFPEHEVVPEHEVLPEHELPEHELFSVVVFPVHELQEDFSIRVQPVVSVAPAIKPTRLAPARIFFRSFEFIHNLQSFAVNIWYFRP